MTPPLEVRNVITNLRHPLERNTWVGKGVTALAAVSVATALLSGALAQATASALAQADADKPTLADFQKNVQAYVTLHKKVEDGIKPLPDDATPDQIEAALTQLSRGITTARMGAKPGDVFQPSMQAWVRRALVLVFRAAEGKQLRASILDENPIDAAVRVNGPYPDSIPLSTMPPQVLGALPKLPEELEFRFVGERLILFDHHAHLIVDYVDRALPRV